VIVSAALVFAVVSQASWLLSARELERRTLVEIAPGQNVRQIAANLERDGIIRDAGRFVLATRFFRAANRLQAGVYEFGPEYSELEVLLALKYGDVAGRTVTIPEGFRAAQIAALLDGVLDVPPAEFMDLVHDPALASSLGVDPDKMTDAAELQKALDAAKKAVELMPEYIEAKKVLERAGELGEKIASMADRRHPYAGLEERLLCYDALPYLSLSRAAERRLLADLAIQALPSPENSADALGLARADALSAVARSLDSLIEVTRVYEAGARAFEDRQK